MIKESEWKGWKKRDELLSQMAKPMEDAFLNQIEIFLLGALDYQETKELRAHLDSGCAACQQALSETARTLRALPAAWLFATALPAETVPPPALKQRLLNSIKNDARHDEAEPQVWKNWPEISPNAPSAATLLTVYAHDGAWEEIGISGIKVKRLFVDRKNDSVTMLVRMPAGASYPQHHHAGVEQCYVLEGDLRVGDLVFYAGDYQCAIAGSIHGVQSTEKGCLLFIASSLHDELIAA